MNEVQFFYALAILLCALAGGYLPLTSPGLSRGEIGFPKGEAFSSGVFLALSLIMLLPSASTVFQQAMPDIEFPIASFIAILAFIVLLAIEHLTGQLFAKLPATDNVAEIPGLIPILMITVIAASSFFLGTALGSSVRTSALLIFMAIILHKGTAGFSIALTMTRSTLMRWQTFVLFGCFAIATPLGILCGGIAREYLTGPALVVKATMLALGAGTFLYMGTLHEMKRATLIRHCCNLDCFVSMLAGLLVTVMVRWIVGEAHRF